MSKVRAITVNGVEIKISSVDNNDYLCISDFVKNISEHPEDVIRTWIRSKTTIEFLGTWEQMHNPSFKLDEFVQFKSEAGSNKFNIRPKKWIETTNAIGITSKAGRYNSGTYAHEDIAMEFGSWLSPEFKLYLITEFKKLKKEEADRSNGNVEWDNHRWLSKVNYRVHTDAIKDHLIPNLLSTERKYVYADEADMLNTIVFGITSAEFRKRNPDTNKNIRDELADTTQLAILANLESLNAQMIREGFTAKQRHDKLKIEAYEQSKSFQGVAIPPRHKRKSINKTQSITQLISETKNS